jgi:hypothetical protein
LKDFIRNAVGIVDYLWIVLFVQKEMRIVSIPWTATMIALALPMRFTSYQWEVPIRIIIEILMVLLSVWISFALCWMGNKYYSEYIFAREQKQKPPRV